MAFVDWEMKAREFTNCNCDFGCPCQFNSLPTDGTCRAVAGFAIDEGHFAETRLDGLRAAALFEWPGAVHEGNGAAQIFIDESADEAQREALLKILTGQEQEPGSTVFNVFASTLTTVHDTVFTHIELDINVDERQGKLQIAGLIEATGEPIKNTLTGQPHRARIDLPNGFEYRIAEVASGTTKATAGITFDLSASHAHFANLHFNSSGVAA